MWKRYKGREEIRKRRGPFTQDLMELSLLPLWSSSYKIGMWPGRSQKCGWVKTYIGQ